MGKIGSRRSSALRGNVLYDGVLSLSKRCRPKRNRLKESGLKGILPAEIQLKERAKYGCY
jgi:hypothetical protein